MDNLRLRFSEEFWGGDCWAGDPGEVWGWARHPGAWLHELASRIASGELDVTDLVPSTGRGRSSNTTCGRWWTTGTRCRPAYAVLLWRADLQTSPRPAVEAMKRLRGSHRHRDLDAGDERRGRHRWQVGERRRSTCATSWASRWPCRSRRAGGRNWHGRSPVATTTTDVAGVVVYRRWPPCRWACWRTRCRGWAGTFSGWSASCRPSRRWPCWCS